MLKPLNIKFFCHRGARMTLLAFGVGLAAAPLMAQEAWTPTFRTQPAPPKQRPAALGRAPPRRHGNATWRELSTARHGSPRRRREDGPRSHRGQRRLRTSAGALAWPRHEGPGGFAGPGGVAAALPNAQWRMAAHVAGADPAANGCARRAFYGSTARSPVPVRPARRDGAGGSHDATPAPS